MKRSNLPFVAAAAPLLPLAALFAIVAVALARDKASDTEKAEPKPVTTDEFVSIFNGENLDGWDGDPAYWSVQDGAITGVTSDANPLPYNKFIIWKNGELDDFELKLQYRIEDGNSGIQYRSFRLDKDPKSGKPLDYAVGGYQADFEAGEKWSGTNYGEKFRGILAKRGDQVVIHEDGKKETVGTVGDSAELQKHIKSDDWNDYHIIARGNHMIHKINGVVMSDLTDNHTEARDRGILAFQIHRGPPMKVQFRNIQLKRLPLGGKKKIVFVAGKPSHAPGAHEHNAGCDLLARLLNENHGGRFVATVYHSGWPSDPTAFQNADALVIYADGGSRHPGFFHRRQINYLANQGVGVGCIHYAVEMIPGETNRDLISWTGGAFETDWSVNPHWDAGFAALPDHPVASGVQPFTINDEWYFNMRFPEEMKNVTPILSAVPPETTMARPDGRHSGNPHVRKMVAAKQPQHVAWVVQRDGGGRGFGFTGGHFHRNWQHDQFRKTALNAIAWIAGADIPAAGIATPTPSDEEMAANLDPKPKRKPRPKPKKKAA